MQRRITHFLNNQPIQRGIDATGVDVWDNDLCDFRRVDLDEVHDPLWPAAMALAQFIDFSHLHAAA